MSSGQNLFTKGQSGELAWVTSSNIPSPLKWFLGPFSDFASSLDSLWEYFSPPTASSVFLILISAQSITVAVSHLVIFFPIHHLSMICET